MYSFVYDDSENCIFDLGENTYTYEGNVAVDTDMTYDPEQRLNGSVSVTFDDGIIDLTAQNIVVDTQCNIPTSGTFTIGNEDGSSTIVDFSNTTCENQVVSYTVDGVEQQLNLD
jgi:hypothetical protein